MNSYTTISQASLHDRDLAKASSERSQANTDHRRHEETSNGDAHLRPDVSRTNSEAPSHSSLQHFETPDASSSSHYQPSDLSDLSDDPFFGASFNDVDGGPSDFLDEQALWNQFGYPADSTNNNTGDNLFTNAQGESRHDTTYPLTPEQTASIHTASPGIDQRTTAFPSLPQQLPNSISPQELQKPFKQEHVLGGQQLTPSLSSSCRTSEDGLAPTSSSMNSRQSPHVTVSVWDNNPEVSRELFPPNNDETATTIRGEGSMAGDLITPTGFEDQDAHHDNGSEDDMERSGLDPTNRPSDTVASIDESAKQRKTAERNEEVGRWLDDNLDAGSVPQEESAAEIQAIDQTGTDDPSGIELGHRTENQMKPEQLYYNPGKPMTDADVRMLSSNRWADGPRLHPISNGTFGPSQPQTSQAAIEKFEAMCRDNDSIFSRQATWGTRRRSLGTVDLEKEVTSGSLFKKLSISRNGDKSHRGSGLIRNIQGVFRRASHNKHSRGADDSDTSPSDSTSQAKRDSFSLLRPPSRSPSGKRKSIPDTASALVSMGQGVASIGGRHARAGSIGASPPPGAPTHSRSSLSVKKLQRPRSKSDLPPSTSGTVPKDSPSPIANFVEMFKKSTAASTATKKSRNIVDDDDDDDDDDFLEDGDMKTDANKIDGITPNFQGFQQYVIDMIPELGQRSPYLVDRIAHQQVVRYKHLLNLKVEHLRAGPNCRCGPLCMSLGGSAIVHNAKSETGGKNTAAAQLDEDDDDGSPVDGTLQQNSFPPDIPMPPTQQLPAEFECQLCYVRKKLNKPSDWTKHVHEDVAPFTCTWDRCKDPKTFKRKADWVRHENEGHRHLEWWTCDVEDCQHTCYRRDNFLQHLVREHRYTEPKEKSKAAMKKASNVDMTLRKVEQCHKETTRRPQDEPCRFCGKESPTWKKLTVHLAKHMENVSLPVLRLVAAKAKELDPDTIISPVQDPPPRQFFPLPGDENTMQSVAGYPGGQQMFRMGGDDMFQRGQVMDYTLMGQGAQLPQQYYNTPYAGIGNNMQQGQMGRTVMGSPYQSQQPAQQVHGLSTGNEQYAQQGSFLMPGNQMNAYDTMNALGLQGVPVSQASSNFGATMGSAMGPQMGYDGQMTPSASNNGSAFSGQGTMSPYMHSPHQNAGNQQQQQQQQQQHQTWDDRHMSGY